MLPSNFDAPDHELWQQGYARDARRMKFDKASTLDAALAIVKPFLDR